MPKGVVYVGRGSRWGNPFIVGKHGDRLECLKLYVGLAAGFLCISAGKETAALQERTIRALRRVKDLRGKNLACWCRPDQDCHADILLALANKRRLPKAWLPKLTRIG